MKAYLIHAGSRRRIGTYFQTPTPARRGILRYAVAAASLLLAGAAAAEGPARRLVAPWPSTAATAQIASEEVRFPSANPFSPAEFGRDMPPASALATKFMPLGRHRPRSIPAVIMLHGSGGVLGARELTYGRQFAAMGVAALVVDAFAARRDMGSGFIDRLLNITESMMIADAYAGFAHLVARHPEIDPARVALVGFSYGAMASMYAMNARVAEQLGGAQRLRFAAHVAFYGPCIARFSDPRTTGAPLLMLYGTADNLIDPARCAEVAADMRQGGSAVRIVAYDGAPHQWDGGWGRRMIGRTMNACRFRVERDGTVRDLNTLLPMSGPINRRIILGLCANGPPYPIGADDAVREKSNRELGAFLAAAFAR